MEKKRYESRFFIVMFFIVLSAGLVASVLDPTSVAHKGNAITVTSLSGINLALLCVGVGMIVLGVIIRFIAIATLKNNFSGHLRIQTDQTLITTGIYHRIRHPAYLGAILFFLGIPLIVSSVLGFLVMIFIVPLLLRRIRNEEDMLTERFGLAYEEYVRQSKKIIPFLY